MASIYLLSSEVYSNLQVWKALSQLHAHGKVREAKLKEEKRGEGLMEGREGECLLEEREGPPKLSATDGLIRSPSSLRPGGVLFVRSEST